MPDYVEAELIGFTKEEKQLLIEGLRALFIREADQKLQPDDFRKHVDMSIDLIKRLGGPQ